MLPRNSLLAIAVFFVCAPALAEPSLPPSVDLSKLSSGERKTFFEAAGKIASACHKAHSLLQSAQSDAKCKRSVFALRRAAKLASIGYVTSEIVETLEKRYGQKPVKLELANSPYKGDPQAPLVLVEFIDFECGHCRAAQPVIHEFLEEYRGKLRMVLKNFPLGGHAHSTYAAEVAAAAMKQGKFWALTAEYWKNQEHLTPAAVDKYAAAVGVDLRKLDREFGKGVVAKDREEGEKLGLQGTPTLFLNGRQITDIRDFSELREWIEEELACR